MHKPIYPPRRPTRPERSKSERTVRIVPPSPVLSIANLEAHNRSVDSLSSVYSRSISGEKHSPKQERRPTGLSAGSRSYSSASTATRIKSPLGAMRQAEHPEVVVIEEEKSRQSSESSDTAFDNAAALQAKLPSVKAVSDFGVVQTWITGRNKALPVKNWSGQGEGRKVVKRSAFKPLRIRKTRDSALIFQSHAVQVAC